MNRSAGVRPLQLNPRAHLDTSLIWPGRRLVQSRQTAQVATGLCFARLTIIIVIIISSPSLPSDHGGYHYSSFAAKINIIFSLYFLHWTADSGCPEFRCPLW